MEKIDGYISKITMGGKTYALKAYIQEIYPAICKNCGAPVEIKNGEGTCPYCKTKYTTYIDLKEQ